MKLGPVGGIFNLAVRISDGVFQNQTAQKFIECMAPKADATKHLDKISRKICPKLEYFVVFSSVACGSGNMGQTNYGMANSVMERIMEERHRHGLPAKAIQWGPVGDVGIVAEMNTKFGSLVSQPIASCIAVMDQLLNVKSTIVSCMIIDLRRSDTKDASLLDKVFNILGVSDIKSVSQASTLAELGADSVLVTEIRQTMERDHNLIYSAKDVQIMTVQQAEELSKKLEAKNSKKDESS
jgi:fatty acid synthase, animal type